MGNLKLKGKDILKLGYPNNQSVNIALEVMKRNFATKNIHHVKSILKEILVNPENFEKDLTFGQIAEALLSSKKTEKECSIHIGRHFKIFGNNISDEAKNQLYTALKLPISTQGALMPDAHSGYGLPIGGVLAVENAVIPYGVGMDIGCRMSLSILDTPISYLEGARDKYEKALAEHTKFGMYETHKSHVDHEIFDRDTFDMIPVLRRLKGKAIKQMGTSGGGNHFVEFGEVEITEEDEQIGLPKENIWNSFAQRFAWIGSRNRPVLFQSCSRTVSVAERSTTICMAGSEYTSWIRILDGNESGRRLRFSLS
jgi:tRNA-splicing ligase RtcB